MSESDHHKCVESWLEERAQGLTVVQYPPLLEAGVAAVSQRAQRTLGDVTVRSIIERVIHTAAVDHPVLSSLTLEGGRVRAGRLHGRARSAPELKAALRGLLVELLTVMGHLTADILTPALHAALRAARPTLLASAARRGPAASVPEVPGSRLLATPWRSGAESAFPQATRFKSARRLSGT